MAESKKVQSSDIISDDLFVEQIKNAKLFEAEIDKLVLGLKEINKETTKTLKSNKDPKNSKQIKEVTKALEDKKKVDEAIVKLEEKKIKVQEKSKLLTNEQIKQNAVNKAIAKDRKAELEALAIIESKLLGTEQKLLAQQTLLRLERKKLNEADKDYAVNLARINKSLDENNAKISANSDKLKQNSMNVGNYTDSVREAINSSDLYSDALGKMNQSNSILVSGFQNLSGQLKGIRESFASADSFGKKLGVTLKAIGIGLLISAIASLGALFKSSREGGQQFAIIVARISAYITILVGNLAKAGEGLLQFGTALKALFSGDFAEASKQASEATDKISKSFDGTSKRVEEQVKLMVDLTKKTYEYENAIRSLSLTLQKVSLDEEDYSEIASDETRTLQERNLALIKSTKLRIEASKISLDIAKKQKELALDAVLADLKAQQVSEKEIERLKKKGAEYILTNNIVNKASEDNIKALEESVKTQIDAEDKLADLPRQENARLRARLQSETEFSIELILKKKLAANSEIQILTNQIADEKNQLSERSLFINQLRAKELSNQQEQFDLFNKGIEEENKLNEKGDADLKQRVNFKELIAIKDAILLEKTIKGLKIAEGQRALVAKIVKTAQDSEIENSQRVLDQTEKEIALKERVLKLEKETLQIRKQVEIDVLKDSQEQQLELLDEYNTKVLNAENVFNNELLLLRKKAFDDSQALKNQEFEARTKQLTDNAEEQKRQIDLSLVQDEEKAKTKLKVDEQLNADLKRLELEKNKALRDANKKETEELKQIEIKKTTLIVNELQKVTSAVSEELDNQNNLRNLKADKEIQKTKTSIDRQRELAEKGAENTLAFEEAQLAKRELKQQEALEKQARQKELIQLTEAYFNALNARLTEVGGNPDTAPVRALGDVLIAKGVAKGIVQFAKDGNEMVTPSGVGGQDGVDDIPFMLTKGEAVIPKKANIENHDAVKSLINGNFEQLYKPVYENKDTASNIYNSLLIQQNDKIISKLDDLIAKPVQQVDVDSMGNIRESILKQVQKTVIIHKQKTRI
jgi:hypothetical protein